jgi:hypothetical protein
MTKPIAYLQKGTGGKKYRITLIKPDGTRKTVQFGAVGYSDYTKHKDNERKLRYDARHRRTENWGKTGIQTAGFWSKWLLWNKPSLAASINNIESKFGIRICRRAPPLKR